MILRYLEFTNKYTHFSTENQSVGYGTLISSEALYHVN